MAIASVFTAGLHHPLKLAAARIPPQYNTARRNPTQHNWQVLLTALRRSTLACPDLKRLDPLLARHRLTDAETGQVVLAALKVELSQVRLRVCIP